MKTNLEKLMHNFWRGPVQNVSDQTFGAEVGYGEYDLLAFAPSAELGFAIIGAQQLQSREKLFKKTLRGYRCYIVS